MDTHSVKAGEHTKSIRHYYNVILLLKGINQQNSGLGGLIDAARSSTTPARKQTAKISEITEGEVEVEVAADSRKTSKATESAEPSEAVEQEGSHAIDVNEKYGMPAIKKTMAQCYVNMATCHAKKEDWVKCRRDAEECDTNILMNNVYFRLIIVDVCQSFKDRFKQLQGEPFRYSALYCIKILMRSRIGGFQDSSGYSQTRRNHERSTITPGSSEERGWDVIL